MPRLTGDNGQAVGQGLYTSSADQIHELGFRCTYGGRGFRYVLAGAADLVAGNVIQAPAQVANHLALTPVAAAIGDKTITVALGATAATANQYAGGYAIISTTPGNGYAYRIASHPAAVLSTSVILTLDEPLQVALTTSSRVDLQANQYSGVIQSPVTTLTGAIVGVASYPVTAAQYGWVQTSGPAPVLIDGTPAVGVSVSAPAAAAGAAAVNSGTLVIIGSMMSTGVSGKNNAVLLNIV